MVKTRNIIHRWGTFKHNHVYCLQTSEFPDVIRLVLAMSACEKVMLLIFKLFRFRFLMLQENILFRIYTVESAK